jgi:hypothetical protein
VNDAAFVMMNVTQDWSSSVNLLSGASESCELSSLAWFQRGPRVPRPSLRSLLQPRAGSFSPYEPAVTLSLKEVVIARKKREKQTVGLQALESSGTNGAASSGRSESTTKGCRLG